MPKQTQRTTGLPAEVAMTPLQRCERELAELELSLRLQLDQMQKYIDAFDDIQQGWYDEAVRRSDTTIRELENCFDKCASGQYVEVQEKDDTGVVIRTRRIRLCEDLIGLWRQYISMQNTAFPFEEYWVPALYRFSPVYIFGCSLFSTCRCCIDCFQKAQEEVANSLVTTSDNPAFEEWRKELSQKIRDLAARIQQQIELIRRKEAECIAISKEGTRGGRMNTKPPPTRGTQG